VRADRLVAIVLLLQAHGRLTAAQLAERLETSERTIRRDLDALSGAGVPVYPQRGRGGGWALLNGHRIDLTGLTADEARALFLVAGPHALASLGVEPRVKSALRKLLAALPEPMRDQAAAAHDAVLVDPARWGTRADPRPQPFLEELRDAIVKGVQVVISYAKYGQDAVDRRVHPFGLVSKNNTWYVLAGTDAGLRTFRLSRVRAVTLTDDRVERPADFDLAAAWDDVQEQMPRRMGSHAVDIRVRPDAVESVTSSLAGWVTFERLESVAGDLWPRFRALFPAFGAAMELARFGAGVEVLTPVELRERIARLGAELVSVYNA
jgi:predicted DNA-binding transcriptional regulator YafY